MSREKTMIYGLDIGGTKIELAVFDAGLNQVDARRIKTPVSDYEQFLQAVCGLVQQADRRYQQKGSVGVGLPMVLDEQQCALSSNIPCVNGKPVARDIAVRLAREVAFENDANSLIYSEVHGGAAKGCERAFGIVLGTGVAGALCLNGEIYRGRHNIAREFGHTGLSAALVQTHQLPLRQCGCGRTACVDQYLSGPSLLWLAGFLGAQYSTVMELMAACRNGERKAGKAFDIYLDCLGDCLAGLTLLFDPEVFILGGGLSNIPELYSRLPEAINNHLLSGLSAPAVLPPEFGDSSGVRGVAILGRDRQSACQ